MRVLAVLLSGRYEDHFHSVVCQNRYPFLGPHYNKTPAEEALHGPSVAQTLNPQPKLFGWCLGLRVFNGTTFFLESISHVFWNSFPVTWQAVRPFRTQVRDLINSGSETVGLGKKI